MVKTYSSISATTNYKLIKNIFKTVLVVILISISVFDLACFFLNIGEVNVFSRIGIVIPAGLFNITQIMDYGKRDILKLLHPTGGLKSLRIMFKSIFIHSYELILVPMFVVIIIFFTFSTFLPLFSIASIIFITIYLIQMLPLKIKQEKYTKDAFKTINDSIQVIKISRIIITLPDNTEEEIEKEIKRHIAAEELITINSSYLHVSASLTSTMISGIRLLLPIAGTILGGIYQMILSGG